jgi:protein-S-isoprenylcysteine O-methyltransferase Ste14
MRPEDLIKLSFFFIASFYFVYISRESLRLPGSHGFYRFFSWEGILGLFLLAVDRWFRNPTSPTQLISWLFLFISGFLVLDGVYWLKLQGHPAGEREDETLLSFEKTTSLVTEGVYRYIRHPLYSSLLFLAWGIFFKAPSTLTVILGIATSGFLLGTAKADEAECVRFFGLSYEQYMGRTKRFIPFLF